MKDRLSAEIGLVFHGFPFRDQAIALGAIQ